MSTKWREKKRKKNIRKKENFTKWREKKTRQWSNCISIHGGKMIYAKTAIWLKSLMNLVS